MSNDNTPDLYVVTPAFEIIGLFTVDTQRIGTYSKITTELSHKDQLNSLTVDLHNSQFKHIYIDKDGFSSITMHSDFRSAQDAAINGIQGKIETHEKRLNQLKEHKEMIEQSSIENNLTARIY